MEAPQSAEEPLALPVTAFPNPFGEVLTVEFQAPAQQPVRIRLTGMQGRTVTQHELKSVGGIQRLELPMIRRTGGFYLLEVATPLLRKIIKVLKQ